MDSLNKNDSPNLASLMKKLSKSELTLILELLQNKTSGEIRTKLSELGNTLHSISSIVHAMSEYDLMYWYCNIRSLTTTLQQSEEQILGKLKQTKSSYCCTKCKKDVVINYNMGVVGNLQTHSCNIPSPSLSGAAPLGIGTVRKLKEYELYQVVHYDNSMEEKLFYKVIVNSGKDIIYFYSIVYNEDEIIQCLVCDCDIPGKANVIQHVLGNRHKKTFQDDYGIILIFHTFFSNLETKYQILLSNFHPIDERKANCLVCNNNLLFRNLKRHMSGPCFDDLQSSLKNSNIVENQANMVVTKPPERKIENVPTKSSGTQECVSFKYDQLVENTIYQGLLEYNVVIDKINCPILQNIDSRIYCLLCNTNVTKHICIHIDSVPHQQNLSNSHTLQLLKKYHQIWTAQPVHIQIEQIYFRRRDHKITCTVCSNFFHYNVSSLAQHVESIEHKRFLMKATEFRTLSLDLEKLTYRSASSRSASTETDRNTSLSTSSSSSNILNRTVTNSSIAADVLAPTSNSPIARRLSETINLVPYDKSVLDELYPDGLVHFAVTIDSMKYPTIIKRETSKYCLLCNIDITTTVLLHANSPQHVELSATGHRRERLKKFHDIWTGLPQIDQCRQVLFKTEEDLICSLCNQGMAYDVNQVRSHIESWDHVQKLMVMQTNGRLDDIQQHAIFSEDIKNGIISNSPKKVSKDKICEGTSTETTEKPISLQDLLNGLKISSSITESKPNIAVAKTSLNKMENPSTKSSGSVAYSKEILDELYGEELIHYHIRVDNIKYPFIQNVDTYKRCLICNIDLISSILLHVNSSPHVAMTNNRERIEQLKNYHDLWLNFSGSDQREQKYFEIGEKLTCSLCQKELEYNVEALTTHIFSTGHGNKTWILNNKSSTRLGKLSDASCTVTEETPSKDLIDFDDFSPVTEVNPTVDELNDYPSLTLDLVTGSPPAHEHPLNEPTVVVPPPLTYTSPNVEDDINCSSMDKCNIANDNSAKTVGVYNTDLLIERSDSRYCIVCERKAGEDHLTTKKHIKKYILSEQLSNKELTYVTKWNELGAAYKMFRNFFLPASSTLTFCLKCGLNVEYNKLESHLIQFHGETSYGLSEKLDASFRPPTTRYPQSILDKYFKSNIPQCNIVVDSFSYPVLLNMTRGLFCLLCRTVFKEDIFTHLTSESHLTDLEEGKRRRILLQYHDSWTAVAIKCQQQIMHFNIVTSSAFFCTLCGTSVPNKKLQLHLDSPQHVAALEQFTRTNDNVNLTEIDANMQLTLSEDDYPKTHLKSQLDSMQHTSLLEGCAHADVNTDLSERKAVVPLIISAGGPPNIQQKLRKNTLRDEKNSFDNNCSVLIEGLESEPLAQGNNVIEDNYLPGHHYPRKANDFARKLHNLDIDIMQSTSNGKLFCLLCQTETKDAVTHTLLPQHEVKASNSSADVEFVKIFHKEWKKVDILHRWLEATFFPVALTLAFCKKCGFNVEYSCLNSHLTRCHDNLLDIEFQSKLDEDFHFTSKKEYSAKVHITLYKDDIPQCDVILEDVSYPVIQTLDDNLRCLLCRKEIIGCQYKHLNSTEHISNAINIASRKRLKSYHDTWLDGDEAFQMQQIYFEKDRDFYCKICVLDLKAAELREHIMSSLHTVSLNKFLINERFLNKPNVFHDIELTPQPDTNKIHMQSPEHSHLSEQHTSDLETEDSDDDPRNYPESLLEEYYPDFDKYYLTMDNIRYPIFRNTVAGCVCMICKRSPRISSLEEHIERSNHKSRMTNLTRQGKLQRFHMVWMKQSYSVQQHQKYFNQSKCLACSLLIDYENIASHVQSELHLLTVNSPLNLSLSEIGDSKESLNASFNVSNSSTPAKRQSVQNVNDAVNLLNPLGVSVAVPKSKKKQSLHSIRKSILNLNSSNIVDKIPLRYSNHAKFLIIDKMNNIFCKCCSKKLEDDMVNIKEHLDSVNHLSLCRVPKKKMKYFCEVCNKHYSMESSWDNHLIDLTHTARFTNLGKTRKERITEYECSTCSLVIYGDEVSLQRHNAIYQKRKTKELTLPKPVLQLLSSKNFIDENSKKLLAEASKASHNQEKERQVCVALVKVLKEVFPMCKAYPFGSRVTGLGYCDSDLDVFLDTGDMYQGNHHQGAEEQANIVAIVAKTLQKHKLSFTDINKVAGARTPIVQVFHKDSDIDCDISFRHGLSVENTAFMSLCLDLQNILRPTMLYLKEWYIATNITGLSSYALTMLMIFYLQTTGYLLSVRELRFINTEKGAVIDGWETIKYTTSLQKMREFVNKCDYNVDQLMYNFFEYYAKFDFDKWVICPLMGYLVAKTQFNGNGIALPPEMAKYVQKLNATDPEYFRNLTPMCVQDPFDLSHNLTKAFSKDMLKKFQTYCGMSKNHLSALN